MIIVLGVVVVASASGARMPTSVCGILGILGILAKNLGFESDSLP
jgi:hypothetical protein